MWDKLVVPYLKSNGEYKPPKTANATPTSTTSGKRNLEPQLLTTTAPGLFLPSPKRAKVDEDNEASIDAEIEKCFIGMLNGSIDVSFGH